MQSNTKPLQILIIAARMSAPRSQVMSSNAAPISARRFAEAIQDLPVGSLHSKGAEIRNSITHLSRSNRELRPHAQEGDQDCLEAMQENSDAISRMEERIGLLKIEAARRGLPWPNDLNSIADHTTTVHERPRNHLVKQKRTTTELSNGSAHQPATQRALTEEVLDESSPSQRDGNDSPNGMHL